MERVKCDDCGLTFKNPYHLRLHIQVIHVRSEDFKCLLCDKIFIARRYVTRHIRAMHWDIVKKEENVEKYIKFVGKVEKVKKEKINANLMKRRAKKDVGIASKKKKGKCEKENLKRTKCEYENILRKNKLISKFFFLLFSTINIIIASIITSILN
jgi:uncharacterized protein YabN with tetrapyrrole methylase and pyrophosphatase domain